MVGCIYELSAAWKRWFFNLSRAQNYDITDDPSSMIDHWQSVTIPFIQFHFSYCNFTVTLFHADNIIFLKNNISILITGFYMRIIIKRCDIFQKYLELY